MSKLMAIVIGIGALLMVTTSAATAQSGTRVLQNRAWTWGPETCVHVRSRRSRETRYAGAPRCRRIAV